MDEYHIANLPERFLMTKHYQSSMQEPNLGNVEAKLNVARQKNHDMAMQYFRAKYGSAAAYEEFTRKHNMGQMLVQPQISEEQELVRHLQRKAKQIQRRFHNQQPFEQSHDEVGHLDILNLGVKQTKKPAANNPWIKQQKTVQRHNRNDTQSSKFVDSAMAPKNKKSEFISEFKQYLDNKEKQKQKEDESKNVPNQSNMNKTIQSKMFSPSKVMNKSVNSIADGLKSNVVEPVKKCYEQELARKIYKDLTGSSKDETVLQKLALVEYIVKNKKILKVLGFSQSQLNNKLLKQHKTKSENEITLQQFAFFILKAVGKEKQINELKQEKRSKDVPEGCMLSKQIIVHFQKIFKQMDVHTDLIIKRLPYIDRLANDPLIKNQLNSPAVLESDMQKSITLRRIFERIQMECLFGVEEQQKVKQYISWNQFLNYFKAGFSPDAVYNMVALIDSLHKSDAMGLVEVPDIVVDILAEVTPKIPTKGGYFNVLTLVQAILKHPEYDHEKYTQVRQQSKMAGLPAETFEEVLCRIKENSQNYMSLKQFLQYFSSKGRPIEQFEHQKNNSARKNFSGIKVKWAADEVTEKQQALDGYDSDPEIYQSKILNKNSPRRSARSNKKLDHATSFIQQSKTKPLNKKNFKVTIPAPFSFEERQKQREKQREERQRLYKIQKQHEEQLKHFQAQPIPSKVLQEGLYEKMLQQDRKKIQQRRKSCMIMTLANEQPFSFMTRKFNKKTKQQREEFVFKAKPIPWYCSVDLLNKKKEAEIIRNQKIAKQAQQNLAKAKLPPRMQRDFQQKQAKLAMTHQQIKKPQSKQKIYREPPDFDKLHRQFEQGLQRKRKQNKATKPQEFNFNHKSNSRPKTAGLAQTHQFKPEQSKVKQNYKKIFEEKPVAASTAKFQQQVQKRRQEMQKKRKQEEQLKLEEQRRQKIDEDLKNKLINATKNKENKQKQQKQKRQNQMKDQIKDFKQWKTKCIQKGRNQPMLVERPLKRDEKMQKMKKLLQISQTLKGNGIKGKDHDSYFNREELLMLQDAVYLNSLQGIK